MGADGPQEDAQQDEHEGTPRGMKRHERARLSARRPAGQRERQRHPDQERKGGLNQVMERAANPINMALMVGEELPERAVWPRPGHP